MSLTFHRKNYIISSYKHMNSEIAMREEELQMPLQVAREIVTKYEKDFNNGIIAYEGLKKDLDIARKVLDNHYREVFRRMD